MNPKYVKLKPSQSSKKKYTAIFYNSDKKKIKTVHFGQKGYSDYLYYHDKPNGIKKKQNYIKRHKVNENWKTPMTAGSLSRWILWNKPTLQSSLIDYKKKFKLT